MTREPQRPDRVFFLVFFLLPLYQEEIPLTNQNAVLLFESNQQTKTDKKEAKESNKGEIMSYETCVCVFMYVCI